MAVADAAVPLEQAERDVLAGWLRAGRAWTLRLLEDLQGDEQWLGPRLDVVNPPRWELGHLAWFQERWCLRDGGRTPSLRRDADGLFDSATVPHALRWDLPLPAPQEAQRYAADVLERVLERVIVGPLTQAQAYFVRLCVFHEDMHDEAFLSTRQTHGWPAPRGLEPVASAGEAGARAAAVGGDVEFPGGELLLGARPGDDPFVFDNEKWGHPLTVRPFALARCAVSEGEWEAFVEAGGYARRDLWSPGGWAWRARADAAAPLYWRKDGGRWWRRQFDTWVPVAPARAMLHVNAHEAQAYCVWAGRRLPSEGEWEFAAAAAPGGAKRARPWGPAPVAPERARLGARTRGPGPVGDCAAGDTPQGVRQLWGNVWEWTSSAFQPYPGFVADPYQEYSAPWFGDHRVLRGGCFATMPRLLRNTWRNFYTPERRDIWAGLRTCRRDGD